MLGFELDEKWDVDTAARHARVRPVTIRQWVVRGHLPADYDDAGHLVFKPIDVIRAEAKTRERARRTVQVYAAA